MAYFESDKVKQIVALSGIVIVGSFLLVALSGFIPEFLGAVILYIICSPVMQYLHEKKKMKKGLAASIIIVASFLIIMIPIFSLGDLLISKLSHILSGTSVMDQMQNANKYVYEHFGFNVLTPENIAKVQETITHILPNVLNQTLNILASTGIMYFIFFYLLYTEHNIKNIITRVLPYRKENAELFEKELTAQTYSNVIGAPLLAIIQGIFAIIGFAIFGISEPFFWGVMCGFLSFIPFVGTSLVWIPAGIAQLSVGAMWQGIGILIYGFLVIVNVDNVFRFIIQKKIANVHPLITVFGVIIGLKWFGLPGLIFGPILISYFLIMIKIYRIEYGHKSLLNKED